MEITCRLSFEMYKYYLNLNTKTYRSILDSKHSDECVDITTIRVFVVPVNQHLLGSQ